MTCMPAACPAVAPARESSSTTHPPGATPMRAAAYPAEDPQTLPAPAEVAGTFLFLLSGHSRGVRDRYFEAQ